MTPSETDSFSPAPAAPPAASAPEPVVRIPSFGELAPMFIAASDVNPRFQAASLGGRWMVLMFFGSLAVPMCQVAHDQVVARRALFDDTRSQFFGVGMDPADRSERGLKNSMPGLRYFWDFDQAVCRLYGLLNGQTFTPTAFLIDPGLRVAAVEPVSRIDALLDRLQAALAADEVRPEMWPAPVLTVPRVLEPDYCRALIEYYGSVGGMSSGFMREIDGRTVPMLDDGVKKRRDVTLEEGALKEHLCEALSYRLIPLIKKAFNWQATRIERYIVACYSADDGGFFRAHRDNTTSGTAHRRFAVSINLNDDYDGGDLRFPEFGPQTHRPPVGGATVFGCSLLHEATPVTRGVRYATLPFLYDEAGRRTRDANKDLLSQHAPLQAR